MVAPRPCSCQWTRQRTPQSDDWKYLPTIYPGDSLLHLSPAAQEAS